MTDRISTDKKDAEKFILPSNLDGIRDYIASLYASHRSVIVDIKKSRAKRMRHPVTIEGVYSNFFTVKNGDLNVNFTIQYIDIITGNVIIEPQDADASDNA